MCDTHVGDVAGRTDFLLTASQLAEEGGSSPSGQALTGFTDLCGQSNIDEGSRPIQYATHSTRRLKLQDTKTRQRTTSRDKHTDKNRQRGIMGKMSSSATIIEGEGS
ncbi:hypothetical protein AVEN_138576-1 [Araneus ventricosus]|uniref:Uncharacterized protein n=1 Tax=Araneus ventricosus TaxID=182803 RepID=A0A4Y2IVT1_ARAVE|nr:hypothetical protein AVEN_138576-1 [Araneus ventricosus]